MWELRAARACTHIAAHHTTACPSPFASGRARELAHGHTFDPEHLIVNGCGGAFLHPTHVFAGAAFAPAPDPAAEATAALYSAAQVSVSECEAATANSHRPYRCIASPMAWVHPSAAGSLAHKHHPLAPVPPFPISPHSCRAPAGCTLTTPMPPGALGPTASHPVTTPTLRLLQLARGPCAGLLPVLPVPLPTLWQDQVDLQQQQGRLQQWQAQGQWARQQQQQQQQPWQSRSSAGCTPATRPTPPPSGRSSWGERTCTCSG